MNIFEQEDVVKGMPDQRLMQEVQRPSGSVPQYLVVSEIQRRADMRKRFAAQQKTPSTTVKDQIVSGGIAAMAPRQPSIGGMTSSPPSPMQPMAPQQAMPQPAAPMRMPTPTPVRMEQGRQVPFTPVGSTIEELARSIYDYQRPTRNMPSALDKLEGSPGRLVEYGESRDELAARLLGDEYAGTLLRLPATEETRRERFMNFATGRGAEALQSYLPASDQNLEAFEVLERAGEDPAMKYRDSENAKNREGRGGPEISTDEAADRNLAEEYLAIAKKQPASTEEITMESLARDLAAVKPVDSSALETSLNELLTQSKTDYQALTDRLKDKPSDYSQFDVNYTPDFSKFKPDYEDLILEQERVAQKIRDDAKKESGAQALIQLGAGIMEGETAAGLRAAGSTAADIMRQARKDISASDKLRMDMKIAAESAATELGILGEKATIDKLQRTADLKVKQYADDRARELQAAQIEGQQLKDQLTLEIAAAQAINAADVQNYENAIDSFVKQGTLLRYRDLQDDRGSEELRKALDIIRTPFANEMKDWREKNREAGAAEWAKHAQDTLNNLMTILPVDIRPSDLSDFNFEAGTGGDPNLEVTDEIRSEAEELRKRGFSITNKDSLGT